MPHLTEPNLVNYMVIAISEVTKTRAVLQILGARPEKESVNSARTKILDIEARLRKQLKEIVLCNKQEGVDRYGWRVQAAEKEEWCRKAAGEEMSGYKSVVQLGDMYQGYEKVLKDYEEKLFKVYEFFAHGDERLEEFVGSDGALLDGVLRKGLERVELSKRGLSCVPDAFGMLKGLVVLNLSHNQIEVIPDSIGGLENLQELYLSSNLLVSLPDSVGMLCDLKILDVSSNKLKTLPDTIVHCSSLVDLDASFNHLTYIPTNIGYRLLNLQRLSVNLNKIRSLPTSICEMQSLQHLDVHFNELRGLPYTIGLLTNLEILNLSKNFSDLTELPDTIGDLINLKELDLSNNQISALPITFGRLHSLTKLNLEQNPLKIPPMETVEKGVEAVKEFMAKRLLDVLLEEEERKSVLNASNQEQTGWLTRSTLLLKNLSSVISESVSGYMGAGQKPQRDPFLDQQL
ncbi:hypothetical protein IFM89_032008 [Coptis chinensis]|uniref:Uncharacterized protein n=1 Tax=Coptis chinensis TaxID=261450 RepID=A0A835LD74_9MAGN|nr:hypothetical protein IFM89_032008 [Coptis chinensis]